MVVMEVSDLVVIEEEVVIMEVVDVMAVVVADLRVEMVGED